MSERAETDLELLFSYIERRKLVLDVGYCDEWVVRLRCGEGVYFGSSRESLLDAVHSLVSRASLEPLRGKVAT